ncbi:MAG: phosphoribosyltransferase family protein [Planctomycetota bacterium]|nr:phosphoribosyltransferase family protein [Planctomycetota bacterium]
MAQQSRTIPRIGRYLGQVSRAFLESAWDFIYPPACPRCGCDQLRERALSFCESCHDEVVPQIPFSCIRCGAAVGPHVKTTLRSGCSECRRQPFAFRQVIRLGLYDRELRNSCLAVKKPKSEPLAAALTNALYQDYAEQLHEIAADFVVPIPHHWIQRICRFHNPAETIADVLGQCLKIPMRRDVLAKRRRTSPQKRLSVAERKRNVNGAFRINHDEHLKAATVLLVDDVLTTGATANEAAKTLKRAGAKKIYVAVIARVNWSGRA